VFVLLVNPVENVNGYSYECVCVKSVICDFVWVCDVGVLESLSLESLPWQNVPYAVPNVCECDEAYYPTSL